MGKKNKKTLQGFADWLRAPTSKKYDPTVAGLISMEILADMIDDYLKVGK